VALAWRPGGPPEILRRKAHRSGLAGAA
jgi:hypothetical protein